ncbi:MAG: hypothetical protein JJT81_11235 [Rubellimicrobium sp.]|nr:hypothetical protein [Rubellimicrobium sp.]
MKFAYVMQGAGVLALVAGLALAEVQDDNEDGDERRAPGVSDPWPGSDGGGSDDSADGDPWDGGEHVHDGRPLPDLPDGDTAVDDGGDWVGSGDEALHDGAAPTCVDCNLPEEAAEMVITGAPRSAERRDTRRDWRDIHQVNRRNVCFDADLYVPLLCDWQRPFLGDRMP